jgi:AcrR family transcriptional regulator
MLAPQTQILDVAERLFARDGYEATSMRDVAQGAGVNVAMLYYHCGSKGEIFKQIYERVLGRIAAFVAETLAAGGEFEDIAARIVDRVILLFVEHPEVPRLLERAHLGEVPNEGVRITAYQALLDTGAAELLRQAKRGKIRRVEARPFITAASGVFLHLAIDATEKGPPDAATIKQLQKHARMFILGALGIEKRKRT